MLKERLYSLRKESGLNQTELAKKLGVGRTTYAMYEQGRRNPDYDTLSDIADFYGVTADYLLGRSNNRNLTKEQEEFQKGKANFDEKHGLNDLSKESREFARRYENLTQEQRDEIERILEWEEYKKSRGE
ncbi:helix-turn-helix domain-containing protein [Marinococcus halophilus]|uniref:helix-turn-helix domain-containing protein n=1 Tax=Marinococcus halophilus TaxID=1371 RepID=UPI0009A81886|nr:helix-turn-helix transcriptional regulator [Marinococcus halophilus]